MSAQPRILDHTALIALFAAVDDDPVFDLWQRADRGDLTLVFPASAVAEASHLLGVGDDAWRALLMAPGVAVAGLGESAAIGCARQPGPLVVRQVAYEAAQCRGVIVTRSPWQYPAGGPPLRVI